MAKNMKKEIEESLKKIKISLPKSEKESAKKPEVKKEEKESSAIFSDNSSFESQISTGRFNPEKLEFRKSNLESSTREFTSAQNTQTSSENPYTVSSAPSYSASQTYASEKKYSSSEIKPIMNISNREQPVQQRVFSGTPIPAQVYNDETSKLEEFARSQVREKPIEKRPFRRKIREPELF